MVRALYEEPVLVGITGIARSHCWFCVLRCQAGPRSSIPEELVLSHFPFLVLGHLAIFASEVTASKAHSASSGMQTQLLCNVMAKFLLGCVLKVLVASEAVAGVHNERLPSMVVFTHIQTLIDAKVLDLQNDEQRRKPGWHSQELF